MELIYINFINETHKIMSKIKCHEVKLIILLFRLIPQDFWLIGTVEQHVNVTNLVMLLICENNLSFALMDYTIRHGLDIHVLQVTWSTIEQ